MHLQTLAITINQSLIGHDRYYEVGFGAGTPQQNRVCAATNAPVGCLSNRTVCVSRWRGFAPTSSEKRVLRAINKQRQGITMMVVPCLLILSYPRFHSADRKLYCGLRAFEVLMDNQSFFSAVRAKKLARTAPEMLCHTENTAPGMVASGYCAK